MTCKQDPGFLSNQQDTTMHNLMPTALYLLITLLISRVQRVCKRLLYEGQFFIMGLSLNLLHPERPKLC